MIFLSREKPSCHILSCAEKASFHILSCAEKASFHILSCAEKASFHILSCAEKALFHILSCAENASFHILSCAEKASFYILSCAEKCRASVTCYQTTRHFNRTDRFLLANISFSLSSPSCMCCYTVFQNNPQHHHKDGPCVIIHYSTKVEQSLVSYRLRGFVYLLYSSSVLLVLSRN